VTIAELFEAINHNRISGGEAIHAIRSFQSVAGDPRAREQLRLALSWAKIYFSRRGAAKYGGPGKVKQYLLAALIHAQQFMPSK
jgi:hypothetical protein